jgi:hypothetical protein
MSETQEKQMRPIVFRLFCPSHKVEQWTRIGQLFFSFLSSVVCVCVYAWVCRLKIHGKTRKRKRPGVMSRRRRVEKKRKKGSMRRDQFSLLYLRFSYIFFPFLSSSSFFLETPQANDSAVRGLYLLIIEKR